MRFLSAFISEDYMYLMFVYPPVSGPLSLGAAGEAVRSVMREVPLLGHLGAFDYQVASLTAASWDA